jgi:hypothetical protein
MKSYMDVEELEVYQKLCRLTGVADPGWPVLSET